MAMLHLSSPHGVQLADDPRTMMLLNGQLHGWVPDFIEEAYKDVADAVGGAWDWTKGTASDIGSGIKKAAEEVARLGCQLITQEKLQTVAAYGSMYPDPQVQAGVRAYQAAAAGCGMAFPPSPPPPPSAPSAGPKMQQALILQALSLPASKPPSPAVPALPAQVSSGGAPSRSMALISSTSTPLYKDWRVYAIAGGVLALGTLGYAVARR